MEATAQQRPSKTVNVGGIEWTVISANERATSHAGRHFFACRCNPKMMWRIDEIDRPLQTGAKDVATIGRFDTKGLSTAVIAATTQAAAA